MYETNDTYFVMESASPSSFVFTVAAINVLGTGKESDITSELYTLFLLLLVPTNLSILAIDGDFAKK